MFIQKEVRKNVSRSRTKKLNEMSFEQRARDLEEQEREEQKKIEGRKKSPFSRFYQINKDNSDYLRSCLDENPKALKLLLFIFDHMDKYNAVICSYKVFQETSFRRSFYLLAFCIRSCIAGTDFLTLSYSKGRSVSSLLWASGPFYSGCLLGFQCPTL